MKKIEDIRQSYKGGSLEREDMLDHPMAMFRQWFDEAQDAKITEVNAMTMSTVNAQGQPSSRTVLLKGVTDQGLIFYTNYLSRKGQEIDSNDKVSLLFFWKELERQVRVEGRVVRLSANDSTTYFQSRPKNSQIGAWASPQSEVIDNRSILEDEVASLREKYDGHDVLPRPTHWGGYIVLPHYYEFWQGRDSRLHDRLVYSQTDGQWHIERLAP